MKKLLLILALLLCTPLAWGNACSSNGTGNWNDGSKWNTCSASGPIAGDTVTINNGHTITCPPATTCAFGVAGATDMTIAAGGVLTVNGTLNQGGGISLIGTLTFNAGSTWAPQGAFATTYQGTTTPAALNFNGAAGNRATLSGTGSNYTWLVGSTGNQVINLLGSYCDVWLGGSTHLGLATEGNGNNQRIEFSNCIVRPQTRWNISSAFYPSVSSTFKFTNSDIRLAVANWLVFGFNSATNFNFNANTQGFFNSTVTGLTSGNGSQITIQAGTGATSQFVFSNVVTENVAITNKSPVSITTWGFYQHLTPTPLTSAYYAAGTSGTSAVSGSVGFGDFTNTHLFSTGAAGQTVNFSGGYSEGSDATGAENHFLPDEASGANGTVNISNWITRGGNAVISRNATSGSVTIDHHTHVSNTNTDCDSIWIDESTTPTLTTAVIENSLLRSTCTNTGKLQLVNGFVQGAFVITFTNYNGFYNATAPNQYSTMSVTGHTYPDSAFGANDVAADPLFVQGTRTIATWDTSLGGTGTAAGAFDAMVCAMNGIDKTGAACTPNASYSVANLLAYVQAGYTPTNPALRAKGNDGLDLGAVPGKWPTGGHSVVWK